MSEKGRDLYERDDAIDSLGLMTGVPEIDMDETPTILFPHLSGEDIVLAKAVYEVIREEGGDFQGNFSVVIEHFGTFFLLSSDGLVLVRTKGNPVFVFKGEEEVLGTNVQGFGKYSGDKFLAGMILRSAWVRIPQEIAFRSSRFYPVKSALHSGKEMAEIRELAKKIHERTFDRTLAFLDSHGIDKFVTKPHDGIQGDGVAIRNRRDFQGDGVREGVFGDSESSRMVLVQEKIEPYGMSAKDAAESQPPSDWNMRVLVTIDPDALSEWKYVAVGIVCRIGEADKPVNISIDASYDSFDNVMEKCGLAGEKDELRKRVEDVAVRATEAIVRYCDKKSGRPADIPEYQVLTWVDVILDTDKNPVVIEVNDMSSGCNYELMKLEGIEALSPIAMAIIGKAALNRIVLTVRNQVLEAHGEEGFARVLDGSATLHFEEEDVRGS